ncbi:hypothetical protein [Roseivivax lentus]|uniref:hypothetical protein n=1 Tax=Roseivivax lentus TaxID=633194 RepID=UPI000970343B|nr:hypothetical protein [Roseivivax lentus]
MAQSIRNDDLDRVTAALFERLPHIEESLYADQGIRLMNVDSDIAARVHNHFTQQGVAVLSVHDSFIIDISRVGELRQAMVDASSAVVGRALPFSTEGIGLDEIEPERRDDLEAWHLGRVERAPGYRARWAEWRNHRG